MAEIIQDSYVFVKPIAYDVEYNIVPFLKSCPLQGKTPVREEDLHLTLCRTKQPLYHFKPHSEVIYEGRVKGAEVWLSPLTKKSNLVILIDSPELVERRREILEKTKSEDMYPVFVPHITMAYDLPANYPNARWWKNEILTKFNKTLGSNYFGLKIRFKGEQVGSSVLVPSNYKSHVVTRPENKFD